MEELTQPITTFIKKCVQYSPGDSLSPTEMCNLYNYESGLRGAMAKNPKWFGRDARRVLETLGDGVKSVIQKHKRVYANITWTAQGKFLVAEMGTNRMHEPF